MSRAAKDCAHEHIAYNSCRNRHCPKCQGARPRTGWRPARPSCCPSATSTSSSPCRSRSPTSPTRTRRVVYDILFKAAPRPRSPSPPTQAPRRQDRLHRRAPHLGLGHDPPSACAHDRAGRRHLDLDGERWISCRPRFFLHVRVLSRLFRSLFLEKLRAASMPAASAFFTDLAHLAEAEAFSRTSRHGTMPSGSSTPSRRPPGPRPCSPISPATPTASPSQTAA